MQIEQKNEKLIDLKKLCELLQIKGIAGARRWCENARIKILTIGNKSVVHRFLVDIELDKHLIKQLQVNYPNKWDSLYQCYQENDRLGYFQLLEDKGYFPPLANVKSNQIKSKRANRLEKLNS